MLAGLAEAPEAPGLPLSELLPVLDEAHIKCTTMVTRRWGLPEDLVLVIEQHHNPFGQGLAHPLVAVICVADHLASTIGLSPGETLDCSGPSMVARARDVLELQDSTWQAVRDQVRGLTADLRTWAPSSTARR
jgi:HD-like signal output (HDOD) protein